MVNSVELSCGSRTLFSNKEDLSRQQHPWWLIATDILSSKKPVKSDKLIYFLYVNLGLLSDY
jgi:hypothetical protein